MTLFVACKLPHGLSIRHAGQSIDLFGPNADYNENLVMPNGYVPDSERVSGGFGITKLEGDQQAAFEDWQNQVTFKDGDKAKGKLQEPFLPLENGTLLVFKSEADARKETKSLAGMVETGTEGIDPATDKQMKRDGVETSDKK